MIVRYLPARPLRLDLDTAAAASGIHPDMLTRLVYLDLVDSITDQQGRRWFAPAVPARVRMILRLHADLALNYTAIALVLDLLARIDKLEGAGQVIRPNKGKRTWT